MSEKVRIRTSKWDLVEEIHEPTEAKRENIQPENTGTLTSNWSTPNLTDIQIPNTSNVDGGNPDAASIGSLHPESFHGQAVSNVHTKDASGNPGTYDRETRNQNVNKTGAYNRETENPRGSMSFDLISVTKEQDDDRNASKLRNSRWSDVEDCKRDRPIGKSSGWHGTEEVHNDVKDAAGFGTSLSQGYRASVSPGNTEWGRHNRSISPRGRRNDPYRSRSRSRSRSWSRSRSISRSRSPIPGFRKEPDRWNDRARQLSGTSDAHCRAFAAGRCQRGALCRYLHEDGDRRRSHRQDDFRDNRYERSRTSVSGRKDYVAEPMDRRDYVVDKTLHNQRNSYDENWRNRSTQQCYDFKMGRCQRGSGCRYLHHDASYRDKHGKDGYSERTNYREGDASFGNARSHEYNRLNDIPCKFFAVGNCRNGNKCKFSHQNQVLVQTSTGGRSFDDKVVQVWDDGSRQSSIPIWTGDKNLIQDFDPGSIDVQTKHATYSQSSESWNPEQTKYPTSEMSPPTVYSDQVNTHDTLNLTQKFDSAVPSEISTTDVSIMMPPDNKEKNMLQVDARTMNNGSWNNNMDKCTDSQSAGSLTCGQGFYQAGIAQQPNIPSLSPVGQVQPSVPPIFSGSSNQQFSYSLTPSIQKQPASSKDPSSAQVIDFNCHVPNVFPSFYSGHNAQTVYSLPPGVPAQIGTPQPNLNIQGPNGNEKLAPITAQGQSQYGNIRPPLGGSAHMTALQSNLNVQCPNGNENLAQLPAKEQIQYANMQPSVNPDVNKQGLQLPLDGSKQCVTLQLNSVFQASEMKDNPQPLSQLLCQSWPNQEEHILISDSPELKNLGSPSESLQLPSDGSKPCVTLQLNSVIPVSEAKDNPHPPPQLLCQSWPNQDKHILISDSPELKNLGSSSESLSGSKVVTSEQIVQLSNLSASLAQIFGKSQQLPQLYASLNPVDCSGMPPVAISQPSSMAPVSAVSSVLQPHVNSTGDSGIPETLHVKYNNPHGFLSGNGVKKNNIQDSSVPLQATAPSVAAEGHDILGDSKSINLEERLKNTIPELKIAGRNECNEPIEKKANPLGESKKLEHADQTEETAADDVTDGDGNKFKDGKATRLFKNALVEFVKDILKPMWKEGNMSKEAHKTIVKKVVDKVTSVMQSNIPQTQDKVDLYLSHSKSKLTKLVQAYVEKYSKL